MARLSDGTSPSVISDLDSASMTWRPLADLLETDYTSTWLNTLSSSDESVASPRDAHAFSYNLVIERPPPTIADETHNTVLECRYPCLHPVLPLVVEILPPDAACDLLDIYFADPDMTDSANTSPYVLSPVIQKKSLLRATNPRPTTSALIVVILWTVSHTARVAVLEDPTTRSVVVQSLLTLSVELLQAREREEWDETRGKTTSELALSLLTIVFPCLHPSLTDSCVMDANDYLSPYKQSNIHIDDALSHILLTSVTSQTGSREACLWWWAKAVSLLNHLRLNSETHIARYTPPAAQETEIREECRRVYWLAYVLDRHLAFIFDKPLDIHDADCDVLTPLPEWIWRDIDMIPAENLPSRGYGPPRAISGTGFFEYFLPLAAILGELVELRARGRDPRVGGGVEASHSVGVIESRLASCEHSLAMLQTVSASLRSISIYPGQNESDRLPSPMPSSPTIDDSKFSSKSARSSGRMLHMQRHTELVFAHSRSMIRFLHTLLMSNFSNGAPDNCLSSSAAHSRAAKENISLMHREDCDFPCMPFILGVYLDCVDMTFTSSLAGDYLCT
ncbi:hypothetical protein BJX62DRAFT_235469 [Aspergillus germanicus]